MPVRWLIDPLTATRSDGGRATWIDDTEEAPEGASEEASEGLIDPLTASRSDGGRATCINDTEGAPEGASEEASEGLMDARTASRSNGGRATWIDDTEEVSGEGWSDLDLEPRSGSDLIPKIQIQCCGFGDYDTPEATRDTDLLQSRSFIIIITLIEGVENFEAQHQLLE
ncbi:hypothetical protein PF001_g28950 [Phytophthora fragariae]|uniref:Uncharacterized protein n=1 Tax=Phytophthora fragariae TaxID=53985 RepID=A0A6A4BAU1_9STRA|nr:hypothetical protein PF003_g12088 [Phytophthora fragariae]KAE9270068.1 hypothetical protein PF001_g28950 [Phytophthora fragariae]